METLGRLPKILLFTFLALGLLRALTPLGLELYWRHALARSLHGYRIRIGDVDLSLFRGRYELQDLRVERWGGLLPIPLVEIPSLKFDFNGRKLRRGDWSVNVRINEARLNLVRGMTGPESQLALDGSGWMRSLARLSPFRIDEVSVRRSMIEFVDLRTEPRVDLILSNLRVDVSDLGAALTGRPRSVARIEVQGLLQQSGEFALVSRLDFRRERPAVDLRLELSGLDLRGFADFFQAYADCDLREGTLDLSAELFIRDRQIRGFARPHFVNLDIIRSEGEAEPGEKVLGDLASGFADLVVERYANGR